MSLPRTEITNAHAHCAFPDKSKPPHRHPEMSQNLLSRLSVGDNDKTKSAVAKSAGKGEKAARTRVVQACIKSTIMHRACFYRIYASCTNQQEQECWMLLPLSNFCGWLAIVPARNRILPILRNGNRMARGFILLQTEKGRRSL